MPPGGAAAGVDSSTISFTTLSPQASWCMTPLPMREAQRTYEANLNVVTVTRQMLGRTLDILRG